MNESRRRLLQTLAAAALFAGGAGAPARAANPAAAARELVRTMGETVIRILNDRGLDRAAREARFRAMYRRYFDHIAIGAWVLGRPWAAATPAQRHEYLAVLEDYIVALYVHHLARYRAERLLVLKSEASGGTVVVTSILVDPDPTAARSIEMKWHLAAAGNRVLVRDVVIDKISMALTERRAFARWLRERGGTLEGLTAKLREMIAEVEADS